MGNRYQDLIQYDTSFRKDDEFFDFVDPHHGYFLGL